MKRLDSIKFEVNRKINYNVADSILSAIRTIHLVRII